MNKVTSVAFAHDQLKQLPSEVTLAVLHPDFYGQHSLFVPVLDDPQQTAVYLALRVPQTPCRDLVAALQSALEEQAGIASPDLPGDLTAAADAIAKMLGNHTNCTLIIDAYDLAAPAQCNDFIVQLAQQLKPGCRVMLSTRELPMALLHHGDLDGKVALVPTHPDRMMLDYAANKDMNVLEVRALGPGRVLINGRRIDHWDGVLPRMLFFYFVDRGMTTRDEIFATFWPQLSTREATNVFHVTKRKISEILETDLTVYWSGFYRISPDLDLHYDVIKFAESVQNAAIAPDEEAIRLYRSAISIYGGPFLSTVKEQGWVERRREELMSNYAEALAGLAEIYRHQDAKQESLGFYLRAAATNPQREDLARAIMGLYRDLGKPEDALATYARLERELQGSLGVSPDHQTVHLAEDIRADL